jgi:hypothetical protein
VADSLIAQDSAPAPLASTALVVGVDADIPSGLTVRGTAGKTVTLRAAGEKARSAVAPTPDAPVVFTKLTAGKAYTVYLGGKPIGTATPVSTPSPAWGLTVSTTDTPDAVTLEWKHQPTRAQGKLAYQVAATPRALDGRPPSSQPVTASAPRRAGPPGLDHGAVTFTVTQPTVPRGKATTAVMNRTPGRYLGISTLGRP